jgi:hypothetical protein
MRLSAGCIAGPYRHWKTFHVYERYIDHARNWRTLGFLLVSLFYFKRFAFTGPLATALLFLGIVIGMDVFVVALVIEKSFVMFASFLGTWLPLALIFGATYFTGLFCKCAKRPS